MVHRELRLTEPFESVWALADWNAAQRLSEPQFMLFMFLLKMLKKGRPLPPRLGLTQARSLLHPRVPSTMNVCLSIVTTIQECRALHNSGNESLIRERKDQLGQACISRDVPIAVTWQQLSCTPELACGKQRFSCNLHSLAC